jgi:beta-N-acetylhexosaminidase
MPSAAIYDCEGARLSKDERAFFRDADPWGFILFQRHCGSADAVRALCAELRDAVGRDAPILIDQEGGRIARLRPPTWRAHPAPAEFGVLWRRDPEHALEAARLDGRLLGRMISDLAVTIDCAPTLDVRQADGHDVIGDRAFAEDPHVVGALGRAFAEGLVEGGALPVMKHIPGHGRARADSHRELPRVTASKEDLAAVDFSPFRMLSDLPMAMTAHVVFEAYDRDLPATLSPSVVAKAIRGAVGFGGLLLTDDLKMQALSGPLAERAAAALAAGCDVALCCNFTLAEKAATAEAIPQLVGLSAERAAAALARRRTPIECELEASYSRLAALIRPEAA